MGMLIGGVLALIAVGGLLIAAVALFGEQTAPLPSASPLGTAPAVPTPDAGQRAAYLEALRVIDPSLVANEDRAVRRGRSTCLDIVQRKTDAQIAENTRIRFTGGDATIDDTQARQVVAAVKVWCVKP